MEPVLGFLTWAHRYRVIWRCNPCSSMIKWEDW